MLPEYRRRPAWTGASGTAYVVGRAGAQIQEIPARAFGPR